MAEADDEGLRDVIIADETARIILKVDDGLGQAASGASTAATTRHQPRAAAADDGRHAEPEQGHGRSSGAKNTEPH